MSLSLSLLVLIAAHLAPADGKYAHHLWLMHGYKTLWKKARRHNDKDQIGILSYLLPSVWTKCVEWLVKRTESKGCCQVCSHLTAQVIHWELPYSIVIYSIYENALKSFFGGCCEYFLLYFLYASSNQDTNFGPYKFQEFQSWIETLQLGPVPIW